MASGLSHAEAAQRTGLPFRDAFADWAHVGSTPAATGGDMPAPAATIVITTFRRPALLVEAARSALKQNFNQPFEILVMDNEPGSGGAAALLGAVPELHGANFRYFVNNENLGMFGNFNRSMELARGEWMTILNDDDLLDPNYLAAMFAALGRVPQADGIVCRKRYFLDRGPPVEAAARDAPAAIDRVRRHLVGRVAGLRQRTRRAADAVLFAYHFRGKPTRRLHARMFFWGPIAGTPLGFLWRRRCGIAVGGFDPNDFPASDVWFSARFAAAFHLRQHRAIAASIRIAENESAKVSTTIQSLRSVYRLQQALAGSLAPRGWLRFAPLVLARLRLSAERAFGVVVPDTDLEQALGIRLGPDRPRRLASVRLLRGGWHPDPA